MRIADLLTEEVFSALAVGYHRTRNLKNVNAIGESGFKAGSGMMYGPGIYMTYSFDDQQDDYMLEHYGPFIVRCKVNLTDFMIFDMDVAKRVYGQNTTLESMFAHFHPELLETVSKETNLIVPGALSAAIAKRFAAWLWRGGDKSTPRLRSDLKVNRPIKGLVFTGSNDGRVMVAYDPTVVIPFGWARVINQSKTRDTVKWNAIAAPPFPKARESMPEFQRAYRFFRQLGFGLLARGDAGAVMAGRIAGDGVYLIITSSEVKAYATRRNPVEANSKLPGYSERFGHRLAYWSYGREQHSIPLTKIWSEIQQELQRFKNRPNEQIRFAEALLPRLLKPGYHVQHEEIAGADYNRDKIVITAGSVKIEIRYPYHKGNAAKVFVSTNFPLELGYNDGTYNDSTPEPDLEHAYSVLLNTAGIERVFAKLMREGSVKWPDDLNPQFVSDLIANLPR